MFLNRRELLSTLMINFYAPGFKSLYFNGRVANSGVTQLWQEQKEDGVHVRPLVIDVEASGFGVGSYPVEVGVALANGETRCMIIRRESDWVHWDDSAESLHGISRKDLSLYGKTVKEVATTLNEWLAGQVVYSDAWGNDSSWLALLFEYANVVQRFKLDSLRSLLDENQLETWHETKEKVTENGCFRRHRASNDALILQETYCRTAEMALISAV